MRLATLAAAAALLSAPAFAYTDQEISSALMAHAWCSFSYNQTTGYSHSKRAVFAANVLHVSSNNEGGSSGSGGSYYGQSAGGENYGWRVQSGVLYLSDNTGWSAHTLDSKTSSSGGFVLLVDGVEWTSCR